MMQYNGVKFTVWDLPGETNVRGLWGSYYGVGLCAIVFVVDSTEKDRIEMAKDELHRVFQHTETLNSKIPLIIFANKQDLPQAVSEDEITNRLELQQINGHEYNVCGCTAIEGKGLDEGFDWLADKLKERK